MNVRPFALLLASHSPAKVVPPATVLGCRFAWLAGVAVMLGLAGVGLRAQSNYATPYLITTFAGGSTVSNSADGTGTAAGFAQPGGVALDHLGNVYVTDTNNHTIRKITPGGVVTTIAGSAGNSGTANGTGSAARFNRPQGIAVDPAGNI